MDTVETETDGKLKSGEGAELRTLAQAGLSWLETHHESVNALNVFPVPDGDTGTNMLLTMRAAIERATKNSSGEAGTVARALAQGALMGARGNSGVILSQFLRGFAEGLEGRRSFDGRDLAAALEQARILAYEAVMDPVEGTILTVIRAGAERAGQTAQQTSALDEMLVEVVSQCRQTLARTPEMLPILKQAGVVDAGGQGLLYILEGMLRCAEGKMAVAVNRASDLHEQSPQARVAGQLEFPYDVQFLLFGDDLEVAKVRREIEAMGDSALVVGDSRMIKVHVHVVDPGIPLSYGTQLGSIEDVVVENMQRQMEARIDRPGAVEVATGRAEPQPEALNTAGTAAAEAELAVVAVAAGPGLASLFRDMGASAIVDGGQSNNPSAQEIVEAIESVAAPAIVVLPNNKNIIMAADTAAKLSAKDVVVLRTRTAPQGIQAMLAFRNQGELEEVSAAMERSARHVASGAITVATRSVVLDGIRVESGDYIGLVDEGLRVAEKELPEAIDLLLRALGAAERELISIYYGEEITAEEAEAVAGRIEEEYSNVEIEVLAGGQPHYLYLFGAE